MRGILLVLVTGLFVLSCARHDPDPAGASGQLSAGSASRAASPRSPSSDSTPNADSPSADSTPNAVGTSPMSSAAAVPVSARAVNADSVIVNQFMSYNTAARSVNLQVIAAFDDARGGLNFNGGSDGDQTVVIPAGWTVHLHMVNKDALPHSAIVIAKQTPPPALPNTPAIAGALTAHLMDGLEPKGGSDDVTFTATPAGSYLLACGVPGHALSGMYIAFDVSSSAKHPSYTK